MIFHKGSFYALLVADAIPRLVFVSPGDGVSKLGDLAGTAVINDINSRVIQVECIQLFKYICWETSFSQSVFTFRSLEGCCLQNAHSRAKYDHTILSQTHILL